MLLANANHMLSNFLRGLKRGKYNQSINCPF